jgi:hypothetical protein
VARQGKRARLVNEFVATVEALGGQVDPAVVSQELDARINAIANQLCITPQTVLRTYIDDDWGRQAADIPEGVPVFWVIGPDGAGDIYPADRWQLRWPTR